MIVSFTGHRPDKLKFDYDLVTPYIIDIKERMRKILLAYQPEAAITGMALGIDTLAADICVEEGIQFTAAIPFKGQGLNWPEKSRNRYGRLLAKASNIYVCSERIMCNVYDEYLSIPFSNFSGWEVSKWCNERNKWMVDNSQALIGVYNGTKGGTHNTIQYAKKKIGRHTTIINI